MASPRRPHRGFTLVELMVTLAVMLVLLVIATPSFFALRQRMVLAATGEQVFGLWQQARLEAAKRNSMVKFGLYTSGGNYCLGAATTTDKDDTTPCDCTTANVCDVGTFPKVGNNDWRDVTINGTPTLGNATGVVVVDPKRTALTDSTDAGAISLNGPPGRNQYRLNFLVDGMGRGVLCESTAAPTKMPAYAKLRCAP
jgi:type IV fimbrial biogenesis protein FimT